jgi:probable selenium-dependent hydroxylase accessory protein YqeC
LEKRFFGLTEALSLEPREHLALVGGGGKTTLLFALAEELRHTGKRVLSSTTTKLWHREAQAVPLVVFVQTDPTWRVKQREALRTERHVFIAQSLHDTGKVQGISPLLADELYEDRAIDYVLVEADGAAGHPVKAPSEHEPVIPSSATKVVAMLGLEAIGLGMEPERVFRLELVSKLTGLERGHKLTPHVLCRLFLHPQGLFKGTPDSAKRVVFLNKLDLVTDEADAWALAHLIIEEGRKQVDQVVIGSVVKGIYFSFMQE